MASNRDIVNQKAAQFWQNNPQTTQQSDMMAQAGWERDPTGQHLNRPIGSGNQAAGSLSASGGGAGSGAGGQAGLDLTGSQSVQSIQQAAGVGLPGPPQEAVPQTAMIPGQPGQMRPGLSTRRSPMADGGLQALQRKAY